MKTISNQEHKQLKFSLFSFFVPFEKTGVVFLFQNNATSCEKSCLFLAQLNTFPSLLTGDGSFPPTPGIPKVTSRNFTSISLKWNPVQNTSGAVVYLLEITFTGEQSGVSSKYLSEVNHPDITFKSNSLMCCFGLAIRHIKTILLQFLDTKLVCNTLRLRTADKL